MSTTETPPALSIDVRTLDTDTLRRLIQQSRTVLRNRRLIPDATVRKATTPQLSDDDRVAIRRAARRFQMSAVTLAEEVLALREHPTLVYLSARDDTTLILAPLVRVDWSGNVGIALTGNGYVCTDLAHDRYTAVQASVNEYVLLDSDRRPQLRESGYTRYGRWSFERVVGPAFVDVWLQLRDQPTRTALQIIIAMAGHDDTPQEALLTWCLGAVTRRLQELADDRTLIHRFLGYPQRTLTVGDLLRPALRRVREGTAPREVLTGRASASGNASRLPQPEWSQPLVRAIERFLVGTNLIAPDLETTDQLDISLRDVWDQYREQEQQANLRAGQLRAAVLTRFGFQEIEWHDEKAWVRTTPPLPPSVPAYQARELLKKQPHVIVTDGCRIYINGTYRCVVEGRSADLPHADHVVRRLLAVATSHRERIHTLTGDLSVLTELFAPYRHARLWDLVADPPETAATLH